MPPFLHNLSEAKTLFETLGTEKGLPPSVIEKDYWVMHSLWSLAQGGLRFEMKGGTSLSKGWGLIDRFSEDIDIRFEPPTSLNTTSDKPNSVAARLDFFDDLASRIDVHGATVVRNRVHDDEMAKNGGISIRYASLFDEIADLKSDVLLEVGFARTAPNTPRMISSWAFDRLSGTSFQVVDNRALSVPCFDPEFTFVEKLQTICRRFRQHRDRHDPNRDRPRQFLRHYYDLYKLLEADRVRAFIGTPAYHSYKNEKIRGLDAEVFATKDAFLIDSPTLFAHFAKEFEIMNQILLPVSPPGFREVMERIRRACPDF